MVTIGCKCSPWLEMTSVVDFAPEALLFRLGEIPGTSPQKRP